MPKPIATGDPFVDRILVGLREEFHARRPFTDDGEVSPEVVALRDALHAFACPVTLLVVEIDGECASRPGASHFSYVRFELGRRGQNGLEDLGVVRQSELRERVDLVRRIFDGVPDESFWKDIDRLILTGLWSTAPDPLWCVVGVPCDAKADPEQVGRELFEDLVSNYQAELIKEFDRRPDFGKIYGMAPLPAKSAAEILAPDALASRFVSLDPARPGPIDVARRWESVADVRLIPRVPEDLARTFEMAREAYVFSAHRYHFGTMSLHYCYLAIEAGIKKRWFQAVGVPLKVRSKNGQVIELVNPAYDYLLKLRKDKSMGKGWGPQNVTVNGQPLPAGMEALVDDLVRRGIVTRWHGRRLKTGIYFRNSYSHREFGVINAPSARVLRNTAWDLNMLFHAP